MRTARSPPTEGKLKVTMNQPTTSLATLQLPALPQEVEGHLAAFFEAQERACATIGAPVRLASQYLRDLALNGGKRIRPAYAWAGYLAGGGLESPLPHEAVLRSLSSLELIQACALIHDDIIDASDTRRGRPTVHRVAEHHHRAHDWLGAADTFGEAVAVLAGDLALAWADDMFLELWTSPDAESSPELADAQRRAYQPWRAMRTEVIGGQLLDIFLEAEGNSDPALAHNVNLFKSAAYTIERPLHLGAALAGASNELIETLRAYGRDIGVAFQLRDDLLGVFGDPAVTGKPTGDDLREGKRTVLVSYAIELARQQGRSGVAQRIHEEVGRVEGEKAITALAELICSTGAEAKVEQRIEELTASGLTHLEHARRLGVDDHASSWLGQLTDRAITRKS